MKLFDEGRPRAPASRGGFNWGFLVGLALCGIVWGVVVGVLS